jgi:hypothetical protein
MQPLYIIDLVQLHRELVSAYLVLIYFSFNEKYCTDFKMFFGVLRYEHQSYLQLCTPD